MRSQNVDIAPVRELALRLPGVRESKLHHALCFKLSGRVLTCPGVHEPADPNEDLLDHIREAIGAQYLGT